MNMLVVNVVAELSAIFNSLSNETLIDSCGLGELSINPKTIDEESDEKIFRQFS